MAISTANDLTDEARFFLAPETTLQRQYEALRAYFVEQLPSHHVACRFGYTRGAFRVLCHQFRHDPDWRAAFFSSARPGAPPTPAPDRVRDLAVALRKQNLSVYDIQRGLAAAGHNVSINALSVLLRAEGFARLPRRQLGAGLPAGRLPQLRGGGVQHLRPAPQHLRCHHHVR